MSVHSAGYSLLIHLINTENRVKMASFCNVENYLKEL